MNRSGLSIPKFITLHSGNALHSGVYATVVQRITKRTVNFLQLEAQEFYLTRQNRYRFNIFELL